MNSRLNEINNTVNELFPTNYINIIINKYKSELEDYRYIDSIIDFSLLQTRGAIRYLNKYDLKLRYGGLLIKIYDKNGKWYAMIKKIDNKRYNISFDNNYIFYCDTKSDSASHILNNWSKCFLSDIESGKYIIN
jgi:hypothetical protein